MINIKDVITLSDDNKYVVVSICNYKNIKYYYLSNIKNNYIKIGYINKNSLVIVKDNSLINKLLPRFTYEIIDELDNL